MAFLLFVLGLGGVAGAIENETNVVIPLVIFIVGVVMIFRQVRKEANEEAYYSRSVNDCSYPSSLERIRR